MQLQLRLSIFRLFHGVRIGSLFLLVLHGLPFSPHTAIKPWGGYLIFAIDFLNARFPLCNQILSSVRHLWIRRQAKAQGFVIRYWVLSQSIKIFLWKKGWFSEGVVCIDWYSYSS